MLRWLQIHNFAIAEHIELDFQNGLSVVTGETGAGKSIIINALGQVLGDRAEANMVRHGTERAEIQAGFDISDNPAATAYLHELELDEMDECQLRRVISSKSGSKAYINGRVVSASVLRQLGGLLMDIHGQHEHHSLLHQETQQQLLDQYAGITGLVRTLQESYQGLQQQLTKLRQIRADSASAREKLQFLQFQVDELNAFAAEKKEWNDLHIKHQRIHHQVEITTSLQSAEQVLFQGNQHQPALGEQLTQVVGTLEKAANLDPELSAVSELLLEALTLINESEEGLRHAAETNELDEAELASIEQRYSAYMDLSRKYQVDPGQLFQTWQNLLEQLSLADDPEQNEQKLLESIQTLAKEYANLGAAISKKRRQYARKLSTEISDLMQSLAMDSGKFTVTLESLPPSLDSQGITLEQPVGRETGYENILFEVSTNAGMPIRPLAQVASGGELSRISLATQLILSDLATVNSLVFDEVDVGVGGKTAAVIGKMLAQLSATRQIICITHLPQVAAFGKWQFSVNKVQNERVQLHVDALDKEARVEEIARMVGGETIHEESLAHARSLLRDAGP